MEEGELPITHPTKSRRAAAFVKRASELAPRRAARLFVSSPTAAPNYQLLSPRGAINKMQLTLTRATTEKKYEVQATVLSTEPRCVVKYTLRSSL